jgi:hypothetical protein
MGGVSTQKIADYFVCSMDIRTTTTRASSLETRERLVATSISCDAIVWKEIVGHYPETRESLGSWKIFAAVPVKKTRAVRKAA